MYDEALFMQRCISLARLGAGYVAPNPMVGTVLVHDGRIIGEGWHEAYGGPHAEVNCLQHVAESDRHLISQSTLYVSLEPCSHTGKTPPCVDLILNHRIPKVVIGTQDPFPSVNGRGIALLKEAGTEVLLGMEQEACLELNKRFFTFHRHKRPYVILKWAQTADGKMAGHTSERLLISNALSDRLVHKWRSEEALILVGTQTALLDDPALTTRLWSGRHPVRAVIDMDLRLPQHLKLFNRKSPTIVFNTLIDDEEENLLRIKVSRSSNLIFQVLASCYQMGLQSIIVEGGALLLQSFMEAGVWDEIRMITATDKYLGEGLDAPALPECRLEETFSLDNDTITILRPR